MSSAVEEIPEYKPGEPVWPRSSGPVMALRLALQALVLVALAVLTAGLWPPYLLGVAIWGWPPNVPRRAQVLRYLRWLRDARLPPPDLDAPRRLWLALSVLNAVPTIPVFGLAWLLDEALYGRQLDATPVVAPLIEISAARSGSTQLARYLEADPELVAPSSLQILFPYLWLWRLAVPTLGRVFSREQIIALVHARMPPEFHERHEGDALSTDTFDVLVMSSHLNVLALQLGPDFLSEEFLVARPAAHNRELWEEAFATLVDRLGSKVLLFARPAPSGVPRRYFVKGHFLAAADALARRYPDARFLTMVREPAPRLQSLVNFLRGTVTDGVMGPPPWPHLARGLLRSETAYCRAEQAWFGAPDGPRRCVLRFGAYVGDLEGTMRRVYRECLDCDTLPDHLPRQHAPRRRRGYSLDRSLAELHIDEAALNEDLADYIAWCRQG